MAITSPQQQTIATMASLSVSNDDCVPSYLNDARLLAQKAAQLDASCHETTMRCLDSLIQTLESGRQVDAETAKKALDAISKSTKSLHGAVSKLAKHTDAQAGNVAEEVEVLNSKVLNTAKNNGNGYGNGNGSGNAFEASEAAEWKAAIERDQLVSALITEHLYTTGNFEAGDALAKEADIKDWEEIRRPYIELLSIERELREHRLDKALAWVLQHRDVLKTNVRYVENRLPFMLHRLYFLHVLEERGPSEAVKYAERHMQQFYWTHGAQLHQLLGGVVFRELFADEQYRQQQQLQQQEQQQQQQPCSRLVWQRYRFMYDEVRRDVLWTEARHEFRRQFCFVIRKPQDSPLLVSVSAGSLALPTLLKYSKVAPRTTSAISSPDQLPIELPLPDEFAFHSTFTCPVSKESNTTSDPAVALPCGHVLNKSSIMAIAKAPARRFKCPYCPQETLFGDCMELKFV